MHKQFKYGMRCLSLAQKAMRRRDWLVFNTLMTEFGTVWRAIAKTS